jgi:hypothetical protein
VRTIARTALAALGSIDLIALAQLEAFRHIVHGPLLLLPTGIGEAAHRAYIRRKVRSALKQALPSEALPPGVLCAQPMPGPCFATVDSRQATAAMLEELRTWLRGLSFYRWDPASVGLGPRTSDEPKILESIGR